VNLLWIVVGVLLIFALLGSPIVGHGGFGYGWAPSGGIGLIVIILLILLLTGRL